MSTDNEVVLNALNLCHLFISCLTFIFKFFGCDRYCPIAKLKETQGPDMKRVLEYYLKLQQKCSRISSPSTDSNKIRVCDWGVVIHKKTFCVALGVSILWLLRNQDRDFLVRTLLIPGGKVISFFRVRWGMQSQQNYVSVLPLCVSLFTGRDVVWRDVINMT